MEKISLDSLNKSLKENNLSIVFLNAKWCGQCKMSKILLDKIIPKFKDINFIIIDVDENNLWDKDEFNLKEVPTFLGYKKQKQVFKLEGYQLEDDLVKIIKEFK